MVQRLLADPFVDPAVRPGRSSDESSILRSPLAVAAEYGHLTILQALLSDPRQIARQRCIGLQPRARSVSWKCLLAETRVFADAADHRQLGAFEAALGHWAFVSASPIRPSHRAAACRRLLLETHMLHARMRRPDALADVRRLGIDVAGLGMRAWVRRRAAVAARQLALDCAAECLPLRCTEA